MCSCEATSTLLPEYIILYFNIKIKYDYLTQNMFLIDYSKAAAQITLHGESADLILRQWFNAKLVCHNSNLKYFPYDENVCSFELFKYGSITTWDNTGVSDIHFNITTIPVNKYDKINLYMIDHIDADIVDEKIIKIRYN